MKMKGFASALVVISLLFGSAVQARAQVSFLAGMVVGGVLFGGDAQGGGSANVLYVLPRASERVRDPLAVRLVSSYEDNFYKGALAKKSLFEIFAFSLNSWDSSKMASKYEILQIVRAIDGSNTERASIWFAYIEKEKVIPLNQLSPLK